MLPPNLNELLVALGQAGVQVAASDLSERIPTLVRAMGWRVVRCFSSSFVDLIMNEQVLNVPIVGPKWDFYRSDRLHFPHPLI